MITADDGREVSSIGRAIRLLGDRWTLLILRDAFLLHTRRFRGWRESLGISDPVLARRLRDLVDGGVLRRVLYSSAPERHEYLLTDSGLELWSLLVAIWAWERRWVVGKAEILPELIHDRCSARADARLGCASCGAVVGARDTAGERSPGAGPERNAPPRFHRRSAPGEGETMALLGDRWSTVMLAAALLGTRRFVDFQRDLGVPPLLLVEGVASGSRAVARYATLLVWVEAPRAERFRRGIERDGETYRPHWEHWARQEEAHFAVEGTRARADLRVDGAPSAPHDGEGGLVLLP